MATPASLFTPLKCVHVWSILTRSLLITIIVHTLMLNKKPTLFLRDRLKYFEFITWDKCVRAWK